MLYVHVVVCFLLLLKMKRRRMMKVKSDAIRKERNEGEKYVVF